MGSSSLLLLLLSASKTFANAKPAGFGQRPAPWIKHDISREFANPSGLPRPYFRYWVPDADVADDVLYSDLASIKSNGWDGAEIICLENYGIEPAVVDPATFGYAGSKWRQKFNTMLKAGEHLDMNIDLALGPTQGASIPIEDPDSPGMNTELVYGYVNLTAGQRFSGQLPEPGKTNPGYANAPEFYPPPVNYTNKFVAAVLARKSNTTQNDPRTIQLDYQNTVDVTSHVKNGILSLSAPDDGDYVLFSFWQRRTGYLAAQGAFNNATNPQNPASWFAYVVDHFSQEGTDLWTSFTEKYVMDGENGDLLRQLGLYAWEDSAEFRALLFWTDDFSQEFERLRGYSPVTALPIQFGTTNLPPSTLNNSYYYFDFADQDGENMSWKLRNDYRQALQQLYETYHLTGLSKWSSTWGLQGSLQPYATAPNLAPPWDMNSAAAHIDAPETESNYFDGVIDAYRAMGGGAMIGQKQIFSSELGAHRYFAYAATWPLIINDCSQSYAGGVNRIVNHGFPYSGWRPETEWPGTTTFEWTYSDMWGPRQPSWQFTREFGDWIGRTQLALQTGKPRVDIALYRHKYISVDIKHFDMGENIFGDPSLANEGYSYVSVSPSLLGQENAVVENGLLANDGPGFSAFVIDNYTNITTEAVTRFLEYAKQDFPIIFVGDVPVESPYYGESLDSTVRNGMQKLMKQPSVRSLGSETELVQTLQSLHIFPAARNLSPRSILYTHRVDQQDDLDIFWAYNSDIYASHATVASFRNTSKRVPYLLNAWTGSISPAVNYTTKGNDTQLWVNLQSNASTIIAFAPPDYFSHVRLPAAHVTWTDIEDLTYSSATKEIVAKSSVSAKHSLTLSNGKTERLDYSKAQLQPFTLGTWTLDIQSWEPNPRPYDNYTSVFAYYRYNLTELVPWYNISNDLLHVSGVGTYRTRFSWNPADIFAGDSALGSSAQSGAYLDIGYVFMTARVSINGEWTGPINVYNPVVDVGPYLRVGSNEVQIEVSTTLRNRLIQFNNTQSFKQANYSVAYGPQAYGLSRPVVLRPYVESRISL